MKHNVKLTDLVPFIDDALCIMQDEASIDDLIQSFGNLTPKLRAYFKELGWHYDDDENPTSFLWDETSRDEVGTITSGICQEYEDEGGGHYWDTYDLSGDDDVDYNGNYPDILLAATAAYVKAHA